MSLRLVLIAAAILLLPCMLFAKGGVYIDDITVKNDGRVVFSDNFDNGKLAGWTGLVAVTAPYDAKKTASPYDAKTACSMHMNMHTDTGTATAVHAMPIESPGVLEVSWRLWIAPTSEQWGHGKSVIALLVAVETPQQNRWIAASASLFTDSDKPYLSVLVNNAEQVSDTSVATGKWVDMTLRIEPGTSTVSLLADKKVAATSKFDPASFRSIKQLRFECAYGDGAQRTH